MNQIGVITLWMVAMQIGHAFADQMYGCVDLENVKRLRNCQCDGNERERRRAGGGSAAAITESLTVRIPPQTSQQNNRNPPQATIRTLPVFPMAFRHHRIELSAIADSPQ